MLLDERGVETVPFVVGRKGIAWHRFRQREMAGEWSGFSDTPEHANASEITARCWRRSTARPTRAEWTRSTSCTPSSCPC